MRLAPGIRIIDQPLAAADRLPPMDVAVFVGFAERGPLHRPVALEDAAQYAQVFGGVLELAARGDGSLVAAHLPAAVDSFFKNGGRRCYVIRVAGKDAEAATFGLPGVRLASREQDDLGNVGDWRLADADFTLRANSLGAWADSYALACRVHSERIRIDDLVAVGDVVRVTQPTAASGQTGWLLIQQASTARQAIRSARAADWLWTGSLTLLTSPPGADQIGLVSAPSKPVDADAWVVERISLDLSLRRPQQADLRREALGLASQSTWLEADAEGLFDNGVTLPGADWPLAGAADAPPKADWMLVPVLADAAFGPWIAARHSAADALVRNGLATVTADLFVDPAWDGDSSLRGQALLDWADNLRYFAAAPRRLLGLHGALGFDDGVAREATWIAVPDAVHPAWHFLPPPPPGTGSLTTQPDPQPPTAAEANFGLCVKPPPCPQPPVFTLSRNAYPADSAWPISISQQDPLSPPRFELEMEAQMASTPDFASATPVPILGGGLYELPPVRVAPSAVYSLKLPVGQYFLRARVWRKELGKPCAPWHVSPWSATLSFLVQAGVWQVEPGPVADTIVSTVHAALRDLCASTREHFALLSVPEDWDEVRISAHIKALRSLTGRAGGAAALESQAPQTGSFIALYHPWLWQRDSQGGLYAHPPEAAVLGVYAKRSRDKGAWAAAGLDALDAVALTPGPSPELIESAGGNALEIRPTGIGATRAFTLSEDEDWQTIGVRRLFILLRRLARREGERYLFEPNDFTLRRSLERCFDSLLAHLMRAGAFRGNKASESYRLSMASPTQVSAEIERGECSLEIRVAPSRPLRFLTLRVVRSGEQLQVEERN